MGQMQRYMSGFWTRYCIYIYVYLRVSKQKLDVYRCIHSSYDILGFDAKIQIIVGTVWATVQLSVQVYSIYCKTYVI